MTDFDSLWDSLFPEKQEKSARGFPPKVPSVTDTVNYHSLSKREYLLGEQHPCFESKLDELCSRPVKLHSNTVHWLKQNATHARFEWFPFLRSAFDSVLARTGGSCSLWPQFLDHPIVKLHIYHKGRVLFGTNAHFRSGVPRLVSIVKGVRIIFPLTKGFERYFSTLRVLESSDLIDFAAAMEGKKEDTQSEAFFQAPTMTSIPITKSEGAGKKPSTTLGKVVHDAFPRVEGDIRNMSVEIAHTSESARENMEKVTKAVETMTDRVTELSDKVGNSVDTTTAEVVDVAEKVKESLDGINSISNMLKDAIKNFSNSVGAAMRAYFPKYAVKAATGILSLGVNILSCWLGDWKPEVIAIAAANFALTVLGTAAEVITSLFTNCMSWISDMFRPASLQADPALTSLIAVVFSALFHKAPQKAALTDLAKDVTTLGSVVRGLTFTTQGITNLFDYVWKKVVELKTKVPILDGVDHKQSEKIASIQDKLPALLKPGNFNLPLQEKVIVAQDCLSVHKDLMDVLAALVGKPSCGSLATQLKSQVLMLDERIGHYRSIGILPQSIHTIPQPVVIVLSGAPGVGKTETVTRLVERVAYFEGVPNDPAALIYRRAAGETFWSGYAGQKICFYDDFDAITDSASAPNPVFRELIMNIQTFAAQLNMPDLSSKGNTSFTSAYVFMTTNSKCFPTHIGSITNAHALPRRISMWLNVTRGDDGIEFTCVNPVDGKELKDVQFPDGEKIEVQTKMDFANMCSIIETFREKAVRYANKSQEVPKGKKLSERLGVKPQSSERSGAKLQSNDDESDTESMSEDGNPFDRAWDYADETFGWARERARERAAASVLEVEERMEKARRELFEFKEQTMKQTEHMYRKVINVSDELKDLFTSVVFEPTIHITNIDAPMYQTDVLRFLDSGCKLTMLYEGELREVKPEIAFQIAKVKSQLSYTLTINGEAVSKAYVESAKKYEGKIMHIGNFKKASSFLALGAVIAGVVSSIGLVIWAVTRKLQTSSGASNKTNTCKTSGHYNKKGGNWLQSSPIMETKNRITNNMFDVVYSGKRVGSALGVKTNMFLTFDHEPGKLFQEGEEFTFVRGQQKLTVNSKTAVITRFEDDAGVDADIAVFSTKAGPQVKDITDLFLDAEPKDISKAFLYTRRVAGTSVQDVVLPVRNLQKGDSAINVERGTRFYNNSNVWIYDAETQSGDCGGVVVAGSKILAMHTGMQYSLQGTRFGPALYRNLFEVQVQSGMQSMGDYHLPVNRAVSSKIVKSELWTEAHTHQPVQLGMIDGVDALEVAESKYCRETVDPGDDELDCAVANYATLFDEDTTSRVLSLEEAVIGFESLQPINRAKSAGLPFCVDQRYPAFKERKYSANKHFWLGSADDHEIHPYLLKILEENEELLRNGWRPTYLFLNCLKDEVRPNGKNPRLLSVSPMDLTIQFRQHYGCFISYFISRGFDIGSAVGCNPYGNDWKHLYNRFKNRKCIAGDFSGWDGALNAKVLSRVKDVVDKYYGAESLIRDTLLAELYNSRHVSPQRGKLPGLVRIWSHSMPSGHPMTSVANTIYNNVLARMVYDELATKQHYGGSFQDQIYFVAFGDDNVWGVSEEISSWFTPSAVTEAYAKFGHTYTNAQKTGVNEHFLDIRDVEFLKRGFKVLDSKIVAPLNKEVIWNMLDWRNKNTNVREADSFVQKLKNAAFEAALHGKEFHAEFLRVTRQRATNASYRLPDFPSYAAEIASLEQRAKQPCFAAFDE